MTLTASSITGRGEESGRTRGKSTFRRQTEQEDLGELPGKKGAWMPQGRCVCVCVCVCVCLPGVKGLTGPQAIADGKPGLGEQAKRQVLGSLTKARGMGGQQGSRPQSLRRPSFHPPRPEQRPARGAGPRSSTRGTTQWFLAPERNLFPGRSSQNRSAPLLARRCGWSRHFLTGPGKSSAKWIQGGCQLRSS